MTNPEQIARGVLRYTSENTYLDAEGFFTPDGVYDTPRVKK